MAVYKLDGIGGVIHGNLSITNNPNSRHWRKYQEWLAQGNTPDPADPPAPPWPTREPPPVSQAGGIPELQDDLNLLRQRLIDIGVFDSQ